MSKEDFSTIAYANTAIWGLFGYCGLIAAMMSSFMFDSPISGKHAATYILAFSMATFPTACLVSIIATWVAVIRAKKFTIVCWCACIPLFSLVIVGLAFAWVLNFQTDF